MPTERAIKCRGNGEQDAQVAIVCENNGRETRKKKKKDDFRPCALSWPLSTANKTHELL